MKKLILGFTDTFSSIENFFINILSREFEIIRDDVNPDYLIFGDKNFGNNNVNYNNKNCIKIFYTGENQRPWDYQCHYAITFDHFDTDRHYRLPLYVVYDHDNQFRDVPNTKTVRRTESNLLKPRDFCSFVVKNPNCEMRNAWFHKLNAYKPVASAGPLFNNVPMLPRDDTGVKAKVEFLSKYKFNLCFENSSWPGYATEKLYEALCGNTVPIYWGSTTIECDFNPKAFLNWHDYCDDDKFMQAIIEVDQNPDLYQEMFLEPMFRDFVPNKYMDLDRFVFWFKKNVYKGEINRR
jgi:hypothetical protein